MEHEALNQLHVKWILPVAIPTLAHADDVMRAFAKEVSEFVGQKGAVVFGDQNPACCFWIETWRPDPSSVSGFFLQIENNGARLTASDSGALAEALEFIKARSLTTAEGVFLPKGVFSTFEVENIHVSDALQPAEKTESTGAGAKAVLSPRGDIPGLTNFARISDGLYRGAQPSAEGFAELKKLGIKTVVNLRSFHTDRQKLKGTGLQYLHIYCKAWHPEDEDVIEFLKVVRDPANQPVFVHCLHGADRTGMMVASYRIIEQGWTIPDAADELPRFGFHTIFKQIPKYLKGFVSESIQNGVNDGRGAKVERIT